jgi:hypothetical protein
MSASASRSSDAPTPEASGQRRHVTVMFCDLVDSTGIAARLDAEEWRDSDDDEASLREWDPLARILDAFGLNLPASAISSRAKGTAAHCQPAERRPASTS